MGVIEGQSNGRLEEARWSLASKQKTTEVVSE
jgi:hypothetical protein